MEQNAAEHILLVVDMEGTSGVDSFRQILSIYDEYWDQGRDLLTEDVNATVRGLFRGGASQVTILDNHGDKKNVIPEQVDPRAKLLPKPVVRPTAQGVWPALLEQLTSPPDGLAMVGYHAMANTSRAYLPHTINPEFRVAINDHPIGEIGLNIGCAGQKSVPAILITGDDAACEEAREMVPGIAKAPTKTARAPDEVELIPVEEARKNIERAAEQAMNGYSNIEPYRPEPPVTGVVTFPSAKHAAAAAMIPESVRDGTRKVVFESPDFCRTTLAIATMTKLALTVRQSSEMEALLELPAAQERFNEMLEHRYARWLHN